MKKKEKYLIQCYFFCLFVKFYLVSLSAVSACTVLCFMVTFIPLPPPHSVRLTCCVHAYHYGSTIFVLDNHQNQEGIPEIQIASQKVWILSFMKKVQETNTFFPIFQESDRSFCARTYRSHFCMQCACAKCVDMQICSLKSSLI